MNKPKKVLIVEDEMAFSVPLEWELKNNGIKVLIATDGGSGVEMALKEHPDLIFLDIALPVMNGIMVIKELRKDPWGKNALIILLTQVDNPKMVAEAVENGVFKYFIKADHSVPELIKEMNKYYSEAAPEQ